MSAAVLLSGSLLRNMRDGFFDLTCEGILLYTDPVIGPLCNAERRLAVKVNAAESQFELLVRGCVSQAFPFTEDIIHACREAFHAYFQSFESMCGGCRPATVAA